MENIIEIYDTETGITPKVCIRLHDFLAIYHGAEYASADKDYISRFKINSIHIINSLDRLEKIYREAELYLAKLNLAKYETNIALEKMKDTEINNIKGKSL